MRKAKTAALHEKRTRDEKGTRKKKSQGMQDEEVRMKMMESVTNAEVNSIA